MGVAISIFMLAPFLYFFTIKLANVGPDNYYVCDGTSAGKYNKKSSDILPPKLRDRKGSPTKVGFFAWIAPKSPILMIGTAWIAIISLAVTSSVLGVLVSALSRKYSEGEVVDGSLSNVFTVIFLGIVSASILLCLFIGGFISGELFPDFWENNTQGSWICLNFRMDSWGKLAVWSFISGFYERFVPNILDKLLSQHDRPSASGRHKPVSSPASSSP